MFNELRNGARCPVVEVDCPINDVKFALAAVEALDLDQMLVKAK